jgi:hypothetical protein
MAHPGEDVSINGGQGESIHEMFGVLVAAHGATLTVPQRRTREMKQPFGRMGG